MRMITTRLEAEIPQVRTIEEVYYLHRAAIYRFCLSQLRDHHLAEDAAADVFAVV